jgi:hypothetical protein
MELKIATCQCPDQLGQTHRFHYYLTVDEMKAPYFNCENYGVRIAEESGADTTIPAITTSASRIDELMTLLVDHQVGPTGLADVVEDWI